MVNIEEEIKRKFNRGMSSQEMGYVYGVTTYEINEILKRVGLDKKKKLIGVNLEQEKDIIEKYTNCQETITSLAKEYNVPYNAVRTFLINNDIGIRPKGIKISRVKESQARHKFTEDHKEEIIEKYTSGYNLCKLAENYGYPMAYIYKRLKEWGVDTSANKGGLLSEDDKKRLIKDYKNGIEFGELYKKYKVNMPYIKKVIRNKGEE